MPISESPVARRLRAVPTPSRSEPDARAPDAPARPVRVDRLEVCLDCEALITGDGPLPDARDPEAREIERGVSRLGIARAGQAVALSGTGERTGHRATPCGCCRRPIAGERAVIERVVTAGADD